MEVGIPEGVMRAEGGVEAAGWGDSVSELWGGNLGRPLWHLIKELRWWWLVLDH